MDIVWLLIVIGLSAIELFTVNLVTIWFVASGIISLILAILNVSFYIQFAVFVLVGTLLLLTTRKALEKMINKTKQKTNLDRVVDMIGIVTEEITPNKSGEVKVDGKRWTAISNSEIAKGCNVRILKIEGVKLIVEEE